VTKDVFLSVRIDEPSKLRLSAYAEERGVSLGELCRQALDEWLVHQSEVAFAAPAERPVLPPIPSLADMRRVALCELADRFRKRFPSGEDDGYQLQWVRACLPGVRALCNADPRAVLAEIRLSVGMPSWASSEGHPVGGEA
jgi:hypothetical protein